ncbi:MAG: adenylyltransferase/cytidyltransferase family protein [Candidatus Lokiarchaeota archaeon]|nr:adenylyltransferase/cytidyltransferase family protein [Candidatus Lokiarchaeota archaeon]
MIVDVDELKKQLRKKDFGMISGGFDPIHKGHVAYIRAASKITHCLVAVVNGDSFLIRKKGYKFMSADERAYIVDNIKGVDYTVIFNSEDDTVDEMIEILRPTYFIKGGDRNAKENIPEWDTCERVGCEIITGAGGDKAQSSSELVRKAKELKKN